MKVNVFEHGGEYRGIELRDAGHLGFESGFATTLGNLEADIGNLLQRAYMHGLDSLRRRNNECPVCNGSGAYTLRVGGDLEPMRCQRCEGSGRKNHI